MMIENMILGIDFGETIESKDRQGNKIENPRAMEVIRRFVKRCKEVYIISKVNPQQMMGVTKWIYDHNFIENTGVKIENIRFCTTRHGKGPIASDLGVTHMIDDRPEVTAHMPYGVVSILFNPIVDDVTKWNQEKTLSVKSWAEIESIINKFDDESNERATENARKFGWIINGHKSIELHWWNPKTQESKEIDWSKPLYLQLPM